MAVTRRQARDRRLQIRATASEETLLKVAAERQGVNVPDFIIRSACDKAEQVLSDQTRFVLDDKQWKLFMEANTTCRSSIAAMRRLQTRGGW
jgi:uncharacterized protein (DUF1778 family)